MRLRAPAPDRFAHQALLYGSLDEFVDAVVPFLRDGARRDEAAVLSSSPGNLAAVREALTPSEAASVAFEESTGRYARPSQALSSYQEGLAGHIAAGRRVRAVGEQPLADLPEGQVRELCLTDAVFNEVCRLPGVSMVCPYDVRAVPPGVVDAVRRSHPEVVEGGARHASASYTDPSVLLAEDRYGPRLPEPAGEVAELVSPRDAAEVRGFVHAAAREAGLAEPERADFVTAVNEVATNAFTHALMDTVRVWREGGWLVCEVNDYGLGLGDLLAGYRHPGTDQDGGWGLWLARQLTDLTEIRTGPAGTTFRLHTVIDRAPGPRQDRDPATRDVNASRPGAPSGSAAPR